VQADVQIALAELRGREQHQSAISALKAVVSCSPVVRTWSARPLSLDLAEAMLEDGDVGAAEAALERANRHVEEAGLPYCQAAPGPCGLACAAPGAQERSASTTGGRALRWPAPRISPITSPRGARRARGQPGVSFRTGTRRSR
jgi:hypothetical protein